MAAYENEPNIASLSNGVRKSVATGLFNLITPTFQINNNVELLPFTVQRDHEMRIDLIFKDMYVVDTPDPTIMYDIDVILFINKIDNPLNIKSGQTLYYPSKQSDLQLFRLSEQEELGTRANKSVNQNKLAVPNKSTKKDSSREAFKKNGFSLPPTAQPIPIEPVRIQNQNFTLGGI